jgi:Flp pilus assembly pilin Flp
MNGFVRLVRRFGRDESGVFAVLFGVMAIVLVALGGAVVDYVTLEQTRSRAQTALDAAALALHPDIFLPNVTDESIRQRAEDIVRERIGDASISVDLNPAVIDRETGRLLLSGGFTLPTIFVQLVGVNELGASFAAEAVRGSVNLEVAVALDVTGSMDGQDILDLRASVGDLIDTIVQDVQEPNYSKVALVPYSQAVNAGDYAEALRGPIRSYKPISRITLWADTTIRNISGVSNPRNGAVTITSSGHGYQNNEWVYIWDVSGTTQLNGRAYQVTSRSNNAFQLRGESGNDYSNWRSGGRIRKCSFANCTMEVTSNNHGYALNEWLHVTDVGGITGVNNVSYQVIARNNNTVTLAGLPTNGAGSYSNNTGRLHCTEQNATEGCTYYRFQSRQGNWNTFAHTTCVTERSPNAFTDLPPSATLYGRNYPPAGNPCLRNAIVPLSDDRPTLHRAIQNLSAAGSTSGSLGILWTWNMLAPNLGYVWPFGSQPAPYTDTEVRKAAIIMTDGEFNTVHCEGVVARNSTDGSGGLADHNRCNAPNGDPYAQARAYCDAMKTEERGIAVYTVGFAITAGSNADLMLKYCASNASNNYLAADGQQLRDAFRQIARNISALRLTQ